MASASLFDYFTQQYHTASDTEYICDTDIYQTDKMLGKCYVHIHV